jgi:hypothetical protein
MGSLTFNLCLVAFMPQAGFDLSQISLILGLQRFVPVFVLGAQRAQGERRQAFLVGGFDHCKHHVL